VSLDDHADLPAATGIQILTRSSDTGTLFGIAFDWT
jgi:hypothetical protein